MSVATVSTTQNLPVNTGSNHEESVNCDRCGWGFASAYVRDLHLRHRCIGKCGWCERDGAPCNAGSTPQTRICASCRKNGRQCNGPELWKQQRGQEKSS